MFLFFLLLVTAAFFLARSGKFGPPPWVSARHSPETEAKRVLAERFARGDIDEVEYRARLEVLRAGRR